jgi:hypothetical protein
MSAHGFSPRDNLRYSSHAADSSIGSTIDGSSFSGLLTRVEIGHIRIGSAGNGTRISLLPEPADVITGREDQWHPVVDFGDQFVGVRRDDRESPYPLA